MRYKIKNTPAKELAENFASFISDFEGKKSPHTIEGYRQAIRLFADFLQENRRLSVNDFGIKSFTQDNAYAFMKWLEKRGVSKKTINTRLSQLTAFLKYLKKKPEFAKYYHDFKDVTRHKIPKKTNNEEPLSREVVQVLINEPNQSSKTGLRYSTSTHMLYESATRISELLGIRIRDLHLSESKPYVIVTGKGAKSRVIYLVKAVVKKLNKYIASEHGNEPNPNAFLFFSRTKGYEFRATPRGFNDQLETIRRSAKEKYPFVPDSIHAHQFRRARATHWLEDGMSVFQISKLLGHENVETTMIYLGFTLRMKNDALSKIESSSLKNVTPLWKDDPSLRDLF